jgi:maleate cis-trans isomerase
MLPAGNGTVEPDFLSVLGPKGVTVHGHRQWDATDLPQEERFDRMNKEIEPAARYLARLGIDVIAYCCTTGSFYRGPGWDEEMVRLIEEASGAAAVVTSPAVVDALNLLGAKKLSIITPYPEWNNQRLKPYLEANGFEVLHVDGHPKPSSGSVPIRDHEPEEIVDFAIERCRPEADVLLVSCTAWRALEVVDEMEERTGKPVITSNQATIWAVLQRLGIEGPIDGFGSFFRGLTPVATG